MIIKVKVKPSLDNSELKKTGDYFIANIKAPAENNKANIELIRLLCRKYGVDHRRIHIKSGASSNYKLVEVDFWYEQIN